METDTGYENWLGIPEDYSQLEYIQYSRGLFPRTMPSECLYTFCCDLPRRLGTYQKNLMDTEEGFYLRDHHEVKFFTDEIDLGQGWKLFVICRKGRLTLLSATDDEDRQAWFRSAGARQEWTIGYGEETAGFFQKPTEEFLHFVYIYLIRHRRTCCVQTFRDVFQSRMDYILDEVQLEAVESSDDDSIANIFLSGCAGSGKSAAGLQWLAAHPMKSASRLCLFFSETQRSRCVEWMEREHRIRRKTGKEELPDIRFERWIDYLMEYGTPYRKRGMYTLNPEQSYAVFHEICGHLPTVFWKSIPGDSQREQEFFLWGEIHGLIKGALFYRNTDNVSEPLQRQQYIELKSFHRGNANEVEVSGQLATALFRIYERYEDYLASHRFLDDNDTARLVLQHLEEIRSQEDFKVYDLVFLDDCQELTEIQLQALLSLMSGCAQKFLALDRCQMLQPTLFHTGFAQQLAERLKTDGEGNFSERYRLPKQYRSLLELMRFQNTVLDELCTFHNLTEEDVRPAHFAGHDFREEELPLWIVDTEENREILQALIGEMEEGQIHILHAMPLRASEMDGKNFCLGEYRGIGVPAPVLLWNLFTEAAEYVSESQAWVYFYMGTVRPQQCLLILEPEEGSIGNFLESVWERGIIEKCTTFRVPGPDGSNWRDRLQERLLKTADASLLDEAFHLYLHEEYEEALSRYCQYPERKEAGNQIIVCKGKLAEIAGEYESALEWFMQLDPGFSPSRWCIYELQEKPELSPELHFAADLYFLESVDDQRYQGSAGLQDIYDEYKKKGGSMGLNELVKAAVARYPNLQEKLNRWTRAVWQNMDSWAGMILSVMDRENDWRKGHE